MRPDDAGAPGTEVGALVQTGHCPNVFFSTNMKQCFGYLSEIDDPVPQFNVPWWFRTDFAANPGHGDNTDLIVNGVVGQADVWVNGHEVATQDTVQGAFTRYTFDVTGLLRHGDNTLALEVYPNNPNSMFTLDNVDWTQIRLTTTPASSSRSRFTPPARSPSATRTSFRTTPRMCRLRR